MAIKSGFFNSVNGDRKYNANSFAEYFATFIGNGVFPNPSNNLQIVANNDMTITVKAGKAWINGYILVNDDDYILELDPADGVLNRIDRIVARYDTADREIRLEVKKGTFASSPTAPALQRDVDAFELGLADIYIGKGIIGINQGNITDLRQSSEHCGIVHGTVDQVDVTTLYNQYTQGFELKKEEFEQEFMNWFATLQDVLDGDTAGNLLNLINAHKAESVTHKVSNRKPTATDDETQNIKQGDIWIYENYINEEEYEFIAYQCMDNKAGMAKWEKYVEKAVPQKIYGVEIDESNSNPETSVVYTDDAVGFTPARGNNGNFSWGSWENIIKDEFKIKPCVLRNPQGTVNYCLDYNDFTKKEDGTVANLTGADGDVMIEFGQELWWKFTRIGSKLKIQLSTKPFDGAIKPAFEIEDGYNLVPFYPLTLTQIIYVLMFKDLDSQTALGKGRTDADSYTNTGATNKKTFCYGSTDATDNVKFLGMEDYFGNRRWWIDGCYYDNNRNMLIGKGNFNDTGSGYENFGQAAPSNLGGYIDKVQGGNNTGLIPASTGGSATTYYCDYGYVSAGGLPTFGGSRSSPSYPGAFYLSSATASTSVAYVGGRLFCSKDSKIYIGAYLGVEQNGKLRSISGYESANDKTIGSFRNLAKANN